MGTGIAAPPRAHDHDQLAANRYRYAKSGRQFRRIRHGGTRGPGDPRATAAKALKAAVKASNTAVADRRRAAWKGPAETASAELSGAAWYVGDAPRAGPGSGVKLHAAAAVKQRAQLRQLGIRLQWMDRARAKRIENPQAADPASFAQATAYAGDHGRRIGRNNHTAAGGARFARENDIQVHSRIFYNTQVPERTEKLLCVMLTFQCTAECENCGTVSSPRDQTWLAPERALAAIDEAADLDYTGVVFTGGEATLAGPVLTQAMRHAASRSFPVRLVTNGHWAVDDISAESMLFEWMCAGLCELNVSTGDRHARFVPLESAVRAASAADRLSLPVTVLVEHADHDEITAATVRERLEGTSVRILEWVWSSLAALPKTTLRGAVNRSNLNQCTGCDGIFSNTTVQPNGLISPCCGLGIRFIPDLQIGRLGSDRLEDAVRRAEEDRLKRRIREEGPERILAWAAGRDPRIQWENLYVHRCHACVRLYKDPMVREVLASAKVGCA